MKPWQLSVQLTSLAVAILLLSACVFPITPTPTDLPPEENTASPEPAVVITEEGPPAPEYALIFVVPERQADLFMRQATQFTEQYDIPVDVQTVPNSDNYAQSIQTTLQGGVPFDVYVANIYTSLSTDVAVPLNEYIPPEELEQFLPGPLTTFTVENELLALPIQRGAACEPFYTALPVSPTTQDPSAAALLVGFLGQKAQQDDAYGYSGGRLLPTLASLYEELGIECPPALRPVPPLPGQSIVARQLVDERQGFLQPRFDEYQQMLEEYGIPYESVQLSVGLSVGALENPEDSAYYIAEAPLAAAIAPISVNLTREQAETLLATEMGVVVGGAFGDRSPFPIGSYTLEPGQQVLLSARASSENSDLLELTVIFEDGGQEVVGEQQLLKLPNQVEVPLVFIVQGSCLIDFTIDQVPIRYSCD